MSVVALKLPKRRIWEDVPNVPNLKRHIPSGYYYVRKFKAGKGELFKTTGEKRLGRARTIADQMISDWIGGKSQGARRKRLDFICDEALEVLQRECRTLDEEGRPRRRKRTCDKDETYFPIIKEYFGDVFADEIDEQFWADWVKNTGRKLDRRLGDIAKYLSKTLTYAFERKYINRKPKIKNPDKHKPKFKTYSPKQIKAFLEHANADLRDLLLIGAECGLRPHENRELRWEFVRFTNKAVYIEIPDWMEKRGKGREIVAGKSASQILRRRRLKRNGPFVFPAPKDASKPLSDVMLSRYWRRMLEAAGITEDIKFHWLRHSFFTDALLGKHLELAKVAAYGGNSPKILFERYLEKSAEKTRDVSQSMSLKFGEDE